MKELGPGDRVLVVKGNWEGYAGRTVGHPRNDNGARVISVEIPGLDATMDFPVTSLVRTG